MIKNKLRRQRILKLAMSIFLLLILLLILYFFGNSVFSLYQKYTFAREKKAALSNRYENTVKHKKELEEKLRHVNTKFGKEEILRENYSMARKGEKLIVVVGDIPSHQKASLEKRTFWDKIQAFFGL